MIIKKQRITSIIYFTTKLIIPNNAKGSDMIYFLQISDTHHLQNQHNNKDIYSNTLCSMIPLEQKLKVLSKTLDKPLEFILHCGDICHNGSISDYENVKKSFQQFFPKVPLFVTVGNHDNISTMEVVFSKESQSIHQFTEIFSDLQIISINSANGNSGTITEEQGSWILEQIERHPNKSHLLFTHHHFIQNQSPMPSATISPKVVALFQSHKISAFLTGHTHYFFQDIFYKTPYYAADSFSFQGQDSGQQYLHMKESSGYNLFSYDKGTLTLENHGNLGFQKDLPITHF
ncbi:MAG: metallophosphoesterase [Eubacteriales bacterium]